MSLLMDALKRAEEAKRQHAPAGMGIPRTPPPAQGLELELESEPQSPLPDLSDHQTSLDAELRASADDTTPTRPVRKKPVAAAAEVASADEQAAARNMFEAKSTTAPEKPNLARVAAIIGAGCVAGLGIGGYFYYQYQMVTGMGSSLAAKPGARPLGSPSPIAAAPVSQAPAATPATAPPPASTPGAAGSAAPAVPVAAAPSPAVKAAPAQANDRPARSAPRPTSDLARPVTREAAPASDAGIRFSTGTQKLNPDLATAYQFLQTGNLQGARDAYDRALRADPRNLDALNGLATIAVREGQSDRAQALYAQALEADPKNAAALTGLIAMRGQGDPAQSESRLKTILAGLSPDAPQVGMIQFALGNLYAGQRRWNEAQIAYFQAYTSDGGNPDYLYNLAVSLDHLLQNRLAAQFYQSALSAADTRAAGFNRVQARARLMELQP